MQYTKEGTYQYSLKRVKRKSKNRDEKKLDLSEEEYEQIKKPLEVSIYYDPVINMLKAKNNIKDLVYQEDHFYSKTELKRIQELKEIPNTGIN